MLMSIFMWFLTTTSAYLLGVLLTWLYKNNPNIKYNKIFKTFDEKSMPQHKFDIWHSKINRSCGLPHITYSKEFENWCNTHQDVLDNFIKGLKSIKNDIFLNKRKRDEINNYIRLYELKSSMISTQTEIDKNGCIDTTITSNDIIWEAGTYYPIHYLFYNSLVKKNKWYINIVF